MTVGVRALCEFTAKAGDLDLRFTPSPTSIEGMEGHAAVRRRRGAGYEAEVALSGRYQDLTVQGRADGFDPVAGRLEEIKTHRSALAAIRPNHRALHWAQAKVYAHLLCLSRGLLQVEVAVVYYHVTSGEERAETAIYSALALREFFEEQCQRYLSWARAEAAHRAQRNAMLRALRFPHARFRAGQRELAVAVYRTASAPVPADAVANGQDELATESAKPIAQVQTNANKGGRSLMAQAPTGIGKTMATVFPLLKAMPGHVPKGASQAKAASAGAMDSSAPTAAPALDKLFFLTAKTTGRALALHALAQLRASVMAGNGDAALAGEQASPVAHAQSSAQALPAQADSAAAQAAQVLPAQANSAAQTAPVAQTASGQCHAPGEDALRPADGAGLERFGLQRAVGAVAGGAGVLNASAAHHSSQPIFPLRVLELQARDKACEHPDKACHGDSCPLAQGFYDRLPGAREAAMQLPMLDAPSVRDLARVQQVCPYYLGQELARWADVVVGDYNHYYDGAAMLHALTQSQRWQVGVLVDEAHNLVERARRMYTAELTPLALAAARKSASGAVKKALDGLSRAWNALARTQHAQGAAYQTHADLPDALLHAVQRCIGAMAEAQADQPLPPGDAVLALYWELLQFQSLADVFGPHALFDISLAPGTPMPAQAGGRAPRATLCIRNVVPAPHLAARHAAAHTTVLFSGTLSPPQFDRQLLGLPEHTGWIDVDAPFKPEQLRVQVAGHISTRWRDRSASLEPIARIIARQFAAQPGNYLCFCSSFDYLRQIAQTVAHLAPDVPLWAQTPAMDEASRSAFLARFVEGGQGVGFAVLGGAFSEGVDLPGSRLIGAFVATLGLPQVNPVNEAMKQALNALVPAGQAGGVSAHPGATKLSVHADPGPGASQVPHAPRPSGYDCTYLYPGLRKVVQAAGRVIRTEHDQGVLVLMDDRYRRADIRALLPRWWRVG